MKKNLKKIFVSAAILEFFLSSAVATAGQHYVEKDEFDGSTYIAFRTTDTEFSRSRLHMWVVDFDSEKQSMKLFIHGPLGVDCDRYGLDIKTNAGVIHHVEATESDDLRVCSATVKVDWVTKSFTVRVPMRIENALIGKMDTTSLKPERYKKLVK